MPRKAGNGHETPAAFIDSIDALRPHLCDNAFRTKKRRAIDLLPKRCAGCESPCCYGQQLIDLLRKEGTDLAGQIYTEGEIHAAMRSAAVDLSMKRVLRRRVRSAHKR